MDKTMADKLMYIPNEDTQIIHCVDYNQWLKRLDTQLNEPIYQSSIKVHKVVKLTIKKYYYTTLGTSVINSPMFPPSLPGFAELQI